MGQQSLNWIRLILMLQCSHLCCQIRLTLAILNLHVILMPPIPIKVLNSLIRLSNQEIMLVLSGGCFAQYTVRSTLALKSILGYQNGSILAILNSPCCPDAFH